MRWIDERKVCVCDVICVDEKERRDECETRMILLNMRKRRNRREEREIRESKTMKKRRDVDDSFTVRCLIPRV